MSRILSLLLLPAIAYCQIISFGSGNVKSRNYNGTPTAGDCTASVVGRAVAVDTSTNPDTIYDCIVSGGSAAWSARTTGAIGANVVTAASNYTSGQFVKAAGNDKTTSSAALAASDLPAAPIAINTGSDPCPTGTHCTFGTTYKAGYVFNQQTATDRIYIDLPTAAAGLQWCIKNSVVGGTGAAVTGIITVKAQSGDYINNDGTIGSSGGVLSSGGAAGDGACFVASAANHWEVFVGKGTWAP